MDYNGNIREFEEDVEKRQALKWKAYNRRARIIEIQEECGNNTDGWFKGHRWVRAINHFNDEYNKAPIMRCKYCLKVRGT
jgi:hypothetical protein